MLLWELNGFVTDLYVVHPSDNVLNKKHSYLIESNEIAESFIDRSDLYALSK